LNELEGIEKELKDAENDLASYKDILTTDEINIIRNTIQNLKTKREKVMEEQKLNKLVDKEIEARLEQAAQKAEATRRHEFEEEARKIWARGGTKQEVQELRKKYLEDFEYTPQSIGELGGRDEILQSLLTQSTKDIRNEYRQEMRKAIGKPDLIRSIKAHYQAKGLDVDSVKLFEME
jgi:hypothetical protein